MSQNIFIQKKKKIIIDCDPGVDDMEAIFMGLSNPNYEIIAITTVAGNGSAKCVYTNTQNILEFIGFNDIPVFKGSKINLSSKYADSDGYFGPDSLGNINLEKSKLYKKEKYSSAQALNYFVNKYPGEIYLIAVGPLTNLALAYLIDKHFPKKLASLSIMGGDRSEKTIDNVSPYAEFNCFSDPCAWKLVMQNFKLANNKKINLIDFKFCQQNLLPLPFIMDYFGKSDKDVGFCLKGILQRKTFDFMSTKYTENGALTCDPFAVFVTLYPEFILEGKVCIIKSVAIDGEKSGHTEFQENQEGNVFLINKINLEEFKIKFFESIRPYNC